MQTLAATSLALMLSACGSASTDLDTKVERAEMAASKAEAAQAAAEQAMKKAMTYSAPAPAAAPEAEKKPGGSEDPDSAYFNDNIGANAEAANAPADTTG